jgi:hypothetical protein
MQAHSRIRFAPLSVPLPRRLQTAAVALALSIGPACFAFGLFLCAFGRKTRTLFVLYLAWLWLDRKTPKTGGRRVDFVKRWSLWRYFADYFPVRLVKTCEYPPNQKYLFAAHPHGILGG